MSPPTFPTALGAIIGQGKAKELLRRACARGKVSHAYLFRGPDGVGKRMTAHAFAAALNCAAAEHGDGCGRCPSCQKIRSGNHPDLLRIDPDGRAIKIDQIRELKRNLAYPPFEAACRVVLLTEVHTMRREAANSLLKTLEEPPADTVLVLTADQAADLLPTIVSRCQVIPFFSLPYEEVTQVLVAEGMPAATAATVAAVTEGSLGRARLLAQKELLGMRERVVAAILAGSADRPEAVESVFGLAEAAAELKEDLGELLELLRLWLRDAILLASGGPAAMVVNRDLLEPALMTACQRWRSDELFEKLRLLDQAERQLRRNCNRALVCEVLFFGLL